MALPDGVLSTSPIRGAFLPPRNTVKRKLIDFAKGGVGLNDPSQGLEVYNWRGEYTAGDFLLSVPGIVAPTVVYSVANVTEFQFTFDQNMQPFIAYVVNDTDVFYRWFDTNIPDFVVDSLVAGTITPRCALDDTRDPAGTGKNDIILTYMRAGSLYYRQQRDRYSIEYLLESGLSGYVIDQVGMNDRGRFQWKLGEL